MSHILYLDFETFSEADIKKVGAQFYARHSSTEALMLAWAINDTEVSVWDIAGGEPMPDYLRLALNSDSYTISAFNAQFERLILEHVLGIVLPPSRFRCSMCWSYSLAFTGGLDDVLTQFGLAELKDPKGKTLINRFSKPQPKNHRVGRWTHENDPDGYAEFKAYCRKDVEVERQLCKALEPYGWHETEQPLYEIDQLINDRGVPVDMSLVDAAIAIAEIEKKKLIKEMKEWTGLANPNSKAQMQAWLAENGLELPNMQAETIEKAIEDATENLKGVLLLQQQLSKTSVTKWAAFKKCTADDGRARGMFQFAGASRTNRWAGRLVQLQNLARGGNTTEDPETLADIMITGGYDMVKSLYDAPMMALSDTIRAAITAPEGYLLNVADLGSIESRVLGWIANCDLINRTFAEGRDTYKVFASELYGVPYGRVTKEQRNFSKPPTLGGGYMLGAKGLIGYADGMGVKMTLEQSQAAVDTFRRMYPEVVSFWDWCKNAVFHTTLTGEEYHGAHGLKTFARGEFLMLQLPSGRCIAYHKPRIEPRPAPWDNSQMIDNFTFMGKDRFTLKWQRISAHPGFVTENIVQAIARDILAVWMFRAHESAFNLIGHVHDELIALEKRDRLEELNELIRQPINWAPGLLLDADGYTAKRYRKD